MEAAAAALVGLRGAALDGLRGGPAPAEGGGGGFERARFWETLGASSQAATQLSLAAARQPPPSLQPPQELERLSGAAQRAVRAAATAYYELPRRKVGGALGRAVHAAVVAVAEGLLRLAEALLRAPARTPSPEQLVSTGGVWEACDRLAGLPRDNRGAVAAALASWLGIVRDALEEMEQALAEGRDPDWDVLEDEEAVSMGNRDVSWSEADQRLLGPCMGLVKAAKACLKKLLQAVKARGQVETAEQVAQLDDLADAAGDVSPSVDELVLSTYPPVNQLTLRLNAAKLAAVLKKVLEVTRASHVCSPSEESWVQFLAGAVDHNMDKIKGFTQGVL
uniref:cyclin-D1-binding protein 1 n=1 Tax=Euleptes europaea TaxID=460621 RepID=UPI00254187C3|nr:cyclin-D1-binding protein 1 [Euleptes europaea]